MLACSLSLAPLAGCGRSEPPPPVDDSRRGVTPEGRSVQQDLPAEAPADRSGMSTKQKVVLLAGAAALYYLYKHHQSAQQTTGPESQYYLSKNGRVYYRDADHRAHWVTPPAEGVRVPASEAEEYRQFQGYNGNATGRDLSGLAAE